MTTSLVNLNRYVNHSPKKEIPINSSYKPFTRARKVNYTEEIPSFSLAEILDNHDLALKPMILTKAKCWKYQKEWRIFEEEGGKPKKYDPKCLTRVFFGVQTLRDDQLKVIKALGDSSAQRYMMQMDSTSFRLKPIDYVRWLEGQSDFN